MINFLIDVWKIVAELIFICIYICIVLILFASFFVYCPVYLFLVTIRAIINQGPTMIETFSNTWANFLEWIIEKSSKILGVPY